MQHLQIFHSDNIFLYNGDCTEVINEFEPNSIDMVFADVPYGTTDCKWDVIIPFDVLWARLNYVGKKHTPYIFTAREPFTSVLVASNIKNYHHKWVWDKAQSGSFQTAKQMPLQIDEDVIVFGTKVNYYPQMRIGKARYKGGAKKLDKESVATGAMANGTPKSYNDQYYPTNIIHIANKRNPLNIHPTQKPVELLEYLILTYTKEGDLVLDPTAGSGTTAIACMNTGRRCICIEKDVYYYEKMVERVRKGKTV